MYAVETGSPHPISHVLFHPNGSTFAVAQPNYGVTLLDRFGGHIVGTIPVPRVADYSSIIFSEGGAYLVISSARGISVCDTATRQVIVQRGKDTLSGAVLAERGEELIAAVRGGLRRLKLEEGPDYRVLDDKALPTQSRATVVALSPCGRRGLGVYGRVRPSLIDIGKGRMAAAVDHPYRQVEYGGPVPKMTFSPGGARLAICDGADVTVYDTPADEPDDDEPDPSLVQRAGETTAPKPRQLLLPVFRLERPEGVSAADRWQPQVAFTPDSRGLLVRRPRNRVQLWDVSAGSHAGEWSWRLDSVTCLAVAPDGLTAVAGARHGRVVVWDLE